jgi:hypothetical protein
MEEREVVRWGCRLLVAAGVAAGATSPGVALAQPPGSDGRSGEIVYQAGGTALRVTTSTGAREVDLGCDARSVVRAGDKLYVACGAAGVVRLGLADPVAPVVEARIPVDGEAAGVFLLDGRPWVELARREARPLEGGAPGGVQSAPSAIPVAPASMPPPASASEPARVSRNAPPRVGDVWEVALGSSMFLPMGTIGVGALAEGSVVRRFEAPVAIHARVAPAGLATGKRGGLGTITGLGVVALDTHYFEMGLGAGAATLAYPSGGYVPSSGSGETVAIAQLARFGARDGVAFDLRSTIIVQRDAFRFGSMDAAMQVPIGPRWMFVMRGGGGAQGYGYGDLGAKYRVTETTGPGMFAVSGGLGGAGLFGQGGCQRSAGPVGYTFCENRDYGGPALRFGLEWRL